MNGLLLLVAAAATGVDVGWQPLAGGGYEYIIQIEPEALAAMQQGRDIVSDLPPQLRDVRRYRITIGTGPVPRIGTPPEMSAPGAIDGHQTAPGNGPRLPASPSGDSYAGDGLRFADRNTNPFPADTGTIGVSDPRLGAATGLGAPVPSRFSSSNPYATDRNNSVDRYNANDGYNSGTGTSLGTGSTSTTAPGSRYATDPRTSTPTAGTGTTDPFAGHPFDRPYTGDAAGNFQNPPAGNATTGNPPYSPTTGTGYQAGNSGQPAGSNINWPTNNQNPAVPGNSAMPPGYGTPGNPPANFNYPNNQNPANYNPQPPYNNQPPANYNPPSNYNQPPAANNNQNNWPANTPGNNSVASNTRQGSGTSEVPKPFLEGDDLPRASFHSGAEGDKSGTQAQWFPFTMALLMLFVSLGGNAYLGWIALTLRNKYLALLEKLRSRMKI